MSELPITRDLCSEEEQEQIRHAVRTVDGIPFSNFPSRVAQPEDAQAFFEFLEDPDIHGPIYNLPRPLNLETTRAFIEAKLEERSRGEGVLFLRFNDKNEVVGYSDFEVWPEWGAGDLGGALRKDLRGRGTGLAGLIQSFSWMFDTLFLKRIVATAALDNLRTHHMMTKIGMDPMGEVMSTRADGTTRRSAVWEVSRADWFERNPRQA